MKSAGTLTVIFFILLIVGMAVWQVSHAEISGVQNSQSTQTPTPSPLPTGSYSPISTEAGPLSSALLDDQYVTKRTGVKLKLEQPKGWSEETSLESLQAAKTVPVKYGGIIVAYGDKLYKFNDEYQQLWSYPVQVMIDFAVVEATNLVYGTAGDNVMFILDASTGKQLYINGRNGRAAYGVVVPYLSDGVLVQDNFKMYREGFRRSGGDAVLDDGLTFWRGTKEIWHIEFPPDAEVVVNGTRILAVTKTTAGIYVKEVFPPKDLKTP